MDKEKRKSKTTLLYKKLFENSKVLNINEIKK